ncbi:unnamed protein product [Ranitomeya imitator]|uniref:Homeobox domain-containing protein n=1 Tax=Ranitomeya imitator TaxID=111125 RepID=A0ABN9LKN0_9NEOB|nr:unnamed protein product [Ranitomeya imitator]
MSMGDIGSGRTVGEPGGNEHGGYRIRMLQTAYDYFWWHRLWLPKNLTWTDLEDQDGRVYAKASDLYISIPLAFLFLIVRYIFEIYVASPFAKVLGVKDKVKLRAAHNPVLESFYKSCSKHPKQGDLENLSRASKITVRQVERWFRRRRNQDRPSLQKKFREASWRFTYYLLAFIAGIAVLADKPWFQDLREVWKDFPKQTMIPSQYWYYMISLGFYWSLLFRVAFDVKRKDFQEQIIHHVATIVLISFSWCANYIRVGTLVLVIHDASDFFLESAKMFNYAGWKETCNNLLCGLRFCLHRHKDHHLSFLLEQDERSDKDETDIPDEDEEEPTKNGVVSNGHSLQNNNHHKAE